MGSIRRWSAIHLLQPVQNPATSALQPHRCHVQPGLPSPATTHTGSSRAIFQYAAAAKGLGRTSLCSPLASPSQHSLPGFRMAGLAERIRASSTNLLLRSRRGRKPRVLSLVDPDRRPRSTWKERATARALRSWATLAQTKMNQQYKVCLLPKTRDEMQTVGRRGRWKTTKEAWEDGEIKQVVAGALAMWRNLSPEKWTKYGATREQHTRQSSKRTTIGFRTRRGNLLEGRAQVRWCVVSASHNHLFCLVCIGVGV